MTPLVTVRKTLHYAESTLNSWSQCGPKARRSLFSQACMSLDSVSATLKDVKFPPRHLPLYSPSNPAAFMCRVTELNQMTGIAAILRFPLDYEVVEEEERVAAEEQARRRGEAEDSMVKHMT